MNLKKIAALFLVFIFTVLYINSNDQGQKPKEVQMDEFKLDKGSIKIYFLGHATLMIDYNNFIIHIDPVKEYLSDKDLPKADIILVTHQHRDHFDETMITKFSKADTKIIVNPAVYDILKKGDPLKNGDNISFKGVKIEAVPAYNTTKDRDKFHPKGRDNGYILTISEKRIYISGDTEDIPEMSQIKNIDIAFLPMNQPYTMTPEQVVNAIDMIKPKIVYPYHFSDTKTEILVDLLKNKKNFELRIRDLK